MKWLARIILVLVGVPIVLVCIGWLVAMAQSFGVWGA